MKKPLVSIIILSWNRVEELSECLLSVKNSKYSSIEVVVVDNGSTDSVKKKLNKIIKLTKLQVSFIQNKKNVGFAEGNNIGFTKTRGKYDNSNSNFYHCKSMFFIFFIHFKVLIIK